MNQRTKPGGRPVPDDQRGPAVWEVRDQLRMEACDKVQARVHDQVRDQVEWQLEEKLRHG